MKSKTTENKRMKGKEKINVKMDVSVISIFLIILGLGMYITTYIFTWNTEWEGYRIMTQQLGMTILSAGAVSVIVEISSIKSYVKNSIKDILHGNFPFSSYSNEVLKDINIAVAKERCGVGVTKEDLNSSVYEFEPKLLNYAENIFYEYHKSKCVIQIDSNKNVFHKKYEMSFEVVNRYGKENYMSFAVLLCKPTNISYDEISKYFRVSKFLINKTDLTSSVYSYIEAEEISKQTSSEYDCKITFCYKFQDCETHKITLHYEYDIPISDTIQVYKIAKPSKKLDHELFIEEKNGNNWSVKANAFTAFFVSSNVEESSFSVEQTVPTNVKISFNDWAIPGAGYVARLIKK